MKKKRIASAVLAAVLFLTALCGVLPASAAALPFRDVPEGEWYYEPVKAVYEAGIMKGTSDTAFGPDESMTRGQIVTILSRMSGDSVAGAVSEMNFRDVNRAEYYADPIGWAVKNGIAKGTSATTFEPEAPVLRQEFAAFFVRYMRYKGIVFLGEEVEPFPDEFPDWAADDIETLHRTGLVKGDAAGRFNPEAKMTRAEIATVTTRFLEREARFDLARCSVVYAEGCEAAAERVAWQIKTAAGVDVKVAADGEDGSEFEIVLGKTSRGEAIDAEDLGPDGYGIKRDGGRIFIDGQTPEGVYRGAAAFLKSGIVSDGTYSVPADPSARVKTEYPVGELTINGRDIREYKIVYPEDASPSVMTGVRDLVKYIEKACGVRLETTAESFSPAIAVRAQTVPIDGSYNDGEENYAIRSEGDDIVITGSPTRGAMYGCYGFLESVIGWYFLSPTIDYLPKREKLDVRDVDIEYSPYFEFRSNYFASPIEHEDFAAKHQLNGLTRSEEYGSGIYFTGGACHTFATLDGGISVQYSSQPCLNDEAVYQTVLSGVLKLLEENPGAQLISVSQNDNQGYCTCEKCTAVAEEEGAQSGNIIRFVNRISDDIAAAGYKDVKIHTFAYLYSLKACKTKPRPNVVIQFCTYAACFTHPLGDEACTFSALNAEELKGWDAICDRIWVWDYHVHFGNYLNPAANYRYEVMVGNIRFFYEHGVSGLFNQGSYNDAERTGEFSEFKNFMYAMIMKDPMMSEERFDELIGVFLAGYYGEDSAPFVRDVLDRLLKFEDDDDWMNTMNLPVLTKAIVYKKDYGAFRSDFTAAKMNADTATAWENADIEQIGTDFLELEMIWGIEYRRASSERQAEIREASFELARRIRKYGIKMSEGGRTPRFESPDDITTGPADWRNS